MRHWLSALFLAALVFGAGIAASAAVRGYCEEHARFCVDFGIVSAASCDEGQTSDCCGETPCEDGEPCVALPLSGEWVPSSAKGDLDPPRWVDLDAGFGAVVASGAAQEAGCSVPQAGSREAPPPRSGRVLLSWIRVRLI